MNSKRNRLLYPLIFAAVASIATFSGIGIAAITGHLTVSQGGFDLFMPIDKAQNRPDAAVVPAVAKASYTGLTRHVGSDPVATTKPFPYRPGRQLKHAKNACGTCGVVQSIEPRAQSAGTENSAIALGLTNALANGDQGLNATIVPADYNSAASQRAEPDTVSYVLRLRMEDGSFRTIYENQRPAFSIGERVKLINGSVVSVG